MSFDLAHALAVAQHAAPLDYEHGWLTGLLHDALEDTDMTADDLIRAGIPLEVVSAVETLTRREGEAYVTYIERVAWDPLAAKVKRADLTVNLQRMDPQHESLRPRYLRAFYRLKEVA